MFEPKFDRIKNFSKTVISRDFSYSAVSFLVLGIIITAGLFIQLKVVPDAMMQDIVFIASAALLSGVVIAVIPLWIMVIVVICADWIGLIAFYDISFYPIAAAASVGLLLSASVELVYQWDKVVILRMGRFRKVHGPGLFLLMPLLDRTAAFVDTRIRATDFSAEKTLTRDTVPVHVDALAFWMIWDAKQAILEVENYLEAVILSAQTALRDSIGKYDLATLLSERDELGKEIQKILDTKTNPWGVTILSIEITDIIIPKELEDSLSKQAQAERERKSRVILAEAEVEVAERYEKAAEKYRENPEALQLRAMNIVYEGLRKNSSMMLMPSSVLDSMNLGTVMGTAALSKEKLNDKD